MTQIRESEKHSSNIVRIKQRDWTLGRVKALKDQILCFDCDRYVENVIIQPFSVQLGIGFVDKTFNAM